MTKRSKKRSSKKSRDEVRHFVSEWREYRGLTQEAVAVKVGRSRGLIAQIESGITELTEEMIYSLASAFQCNPWDILRINPLVDDVVLDIVMHLQSVSPSTRAEALGFIRGLSRSKIN